VEALEVTEHDWTIHTEVFEGPLDLLLHLVRRDGIDLRRVSIARICDAYLEYLDRLRGLRLNLAADYLVMAATLCHLKSLSLLPRPPSPTTDDGAPDEDPAEALARQLERYQIYREAAEGLDDRPVVGRDVFTRQPEEVDAADRPFVAGVDAFGLLDLYWELLSVQAAGPPTHTLPDDGPDLRRCCELVIAAIDAGGGRGELGAILRAFERAGERVIAFVAGLEMVRLQWLGIEQDGHLAPVRVWFKDRAGIDLALLTGVIAGEDEPGPDDGDAEQPEAPPDSPPPTKPSKGRARGRRDP
jgi:segregation and condensation protein A